MKHDWPSFSFIHRLNKIEAQLSQSLTQNLLQAETRETREWKLLLTVETEVNGTQRVQINPILHTAWLNNHALTLKSNTA